MYFSSGWPVVGKQNTNEKQTGTTVSQILVEFANEHHKSMANTTVFSLNETLFDYAKSNLLQLLVTPNSTYELPRVGKASVTYVQRVTNNTFRTDNNIDNEFCMLAKKTSAF